MKTALRPPLMLSEEADRDGDGRYAVYIKEGFVALLLLELKHCTSLKTPLRSVANEIPQNPLTNLIILTPRRPGARERICRDCDPSKLSRDRRSCRNSEL